MKKESMVSCVLMGITALAVTLSTLAVKGNLWQILPLYVSLYVYTLQMRASRYAYLVGSLNSLFYAAVYWIWGLYSSAASALLISFPIQLFTFISWSRKPYKNSTVFKKLRPKALCGTVAGMLLLWGLLTALSMGWGANQPILDTLLSAIGLAASVLTMLQFVDGAYFTVAGGVGSLVLWAIVALGDPSGVPYLVFSFYTVICTVRAAIKRNDLYKEQKKQ